MHSLTRKFPGMYYLGKTVTADYAVIRFHPLLILFPLTHETCEQTERTSVDPGPDKYQVIITSNVISYYTFVNIPPVHISEKRGSHSPTMLRNGPCQEMRRDMLYRNVSGYR